jgi:hypothetical protein
MEDQPRRVLPERLGGTELTGEHLNPNLTLVLDPFLGLDQLRPTR